MVNYCENVTCLNRGVCRPLFQNYSCECLGTSYSGRHCEFMANRIWVIQTVSKSFGYASILFLVSVVMFIVAMDILKYCFGIDLTKEELEKIRKTKAINKIKHKPVIVRHTYVNESSTTAEATV